MRDRNWPSLSPSSKGFWYRRRTGRTKGEQRSIQLGAWLSRLGVDGSIRRLLSICLRIATPRFKLYAERIATTRIPSQSLRTLFLAAWTLISKIRPKMGCCNQATLLWKLLCRFPAQQSEPLALIQWPRNDNSSDSPTGKDGRWKEGITRHVKERKA